MSAQGALPPAPARRKALAAVALLAVVTTVAGYFVGRRAGAVHDVMVATPADAERIAFVREAPCDEGTCQTLWMGTTKDDAVQVAALTPLVERCEEIAWARDGYRVGFLINGYQLRIFDADSRNQVGQANLIDPVGTPSSRIARGITFSENGAAVTFDDCPRYHSGCRSGLKAVR
jgi:hypothetical protein